MGLTLAALAIQREQARELVELLAKRYPERRFELIADAAYTNCSLIKGRSSNVTVIGRGRLDAALYAPASALARLWLSRAEQRPRGVSRHV